MRLLYGPRLASPGCPEGDPACVNRQGLVLGYDSVPLDAIRPASRVVFDAPRGSAETETGVFDCDWIG